MLADLRERYLQLLEHGHDPLHRPELAGQARDRGGDLPGVQRVVDAPVAHQVPAQLRGQPVGRLAGDHRKLDARPPGRGADEPDRRVQQVRRDKGSHRHEVTVPRAGCIATGSCG